MTFSFLAAALVSAALFLLILLPPLVRRGGGADGVDQREGGDPERAAVLRARLAEIEADRSSGLLDEALADEAVLEAQRAALRGARTSAAGQGGGARRGWRYAAVAAIASAPIGVALVYPYVGAPDYRERLAAEGSAPPAVEGSAPGAASAEAAAIAALPPAERMAMIENMVDGLAARLERQPDDPDGWRMLARSQTTLGRFEAGAESYRRLLGLIDGALEDWRGFANARLGQAGQGAFPADQEFAEILEEIESRRPGDPFVMFYRAGALRENGDHAGAAALWRQLLARLPANAPVRGSLEALAEEAEAATGGNGEGDPVTANPIP